MPPRSARPRKTGLRATLACLGALALALGCDGEADEDAGSADAGRTSASDAGSVDGGGRDSGADAASGGDAGGADAGGGWDGRASDLPASVRARMTDVSWRDGCPVGLDALSYLEMPHWGLDGQIHRGEMVVASAVSADVLMVFEAMFDARFPIERMQLVDDYGADDDLSMEANNTSAFNCRAVTGGTTFSQHSYGEAIDINPIQNPYVRGTTVLPPAGRAYLDRSDVRPAMIVAGDAVTDAFGAIGWGWGGDFRTLKDYQHFSSTGR